MTNAIITDPGAWERRAKAFVVRSHRHLWGKNNEDPLAFLFLQGLNNQFIRDLYLGWNKFGQERPFNTWGMKSGPEGSDKFLLPAGIVIPYIKDKNLIAAFLHTFNTESPQTISIPGSRTSFIGLGSGKKNIIVITDLLDGLYLFQEKQADCLVIIATDPSKPFEPDQISLLKQADQIRVYQKKGQGPIFCLNQSGIISKERIVTYKDPGELIFP